MLSPKHLWYPSALHCMLMLYCVESQVSLIPLNYYHHVSLFDASTMTIICSNNTLLLTINFSPHTFPVTDDTTLLKWEFMSYCSEIMRWPRNVLLSAFVGHQGARKFILWHRGFQY